MKKLADADAFVFDVDGTLVLADEPNAAAGEVRVLGGAVDVLRTLRDRHTPFTCFTNGSAQTPHAAEYIRRRHPGQLVLAFGNDGVLDPLRQADIPLARLEGSDRAKVVLVGGDQEFNYTKLEAACRAVWAGAPLLAMEMAAALLGTVPARMVVIGNDLELEVRMARNSGAFSVLVLSGSTSESDVTGASAAD